MGKGEYLGEFEQVVLLSMARLESEAYGMSIHEEILATTGRDVSVAAVYVTLSRLEKKGYVSARTGEPTPDRGGRAKRFFKLEPAGADALRKSKELLDRLWKGARFHLREGRS